MIYDKNGYTCLEEDGQYNVYFEDEQVGSFDTDKDAIEFIEDKLKEKDDKEDNIDSNKIQTLPIQYSIGDSELKRNYSDGIYDAFVIVWANNVNKRVDSRVYKDEESAKKAISFRKGNFKVTHWYAINGELKDKLPPKKLKEDINMDEKLVSSLVIDLYPEDNQVHIYHKERPEGGEYYSWTTGSDKELIHIFEDYIKNIYLKDF